MVDRIDIVRMIKDGISNQEDYLEWAKEDAKEIPQQIDALKNELANLKNASKASGIDLSITIQSVEDRIKDRESILKSAKESIKSIPKEIKWLKSRLSKTQARKNK